MHEIQATDEQWEVLSHDMSLDCEYEKGWTLAKGQHSPPALDGTLEAFAQAWGWEAFWNYCQGSIQSGYGINWYHRFVASGRGRRA